MAGAPSENDVLTFWEDLQADVFQTVFLTGLQDVSKPIEAFAFFADRLRETQEGVRGLEVKIPFKIRGNNSLRAITRKGFFPTGSPVVTDSQNFQLKGCAGAAQVTIEDILGTQGDFNLMMDLMTDALRDIFEQIPRFKRNMVWTSDTGVSAVVESISTLTVTVDNAGLDFTASGDRLKYLWQNVYVKIFTAAGVEKGVVQILEIDLDNDTFEIDMDTSPVGIAAGDLVVISDIVGLEDNFNNSSPGILDVIDDDNTFQGTDRSLVGNQWARAKVDDNGGIGRLPTRTRLENYFHRVFNPRFAVSDYRVISDYWERNFRENQRWMNNQERFVDGYDAVQIAQTMLVADEDAHQDKIIVPDLDNMALYSKGEFTNPRNEGWRRIENRPIYEFVLIWYGLLGAVDVRFMGKFLDVDITAAS